MPMPTPLGKAICVSFCKILEARGKSRSTTFVERSKRNFQTAYKRGFPFARDLRRPTQTQSAVHVYVADIADMLRSCFDLIAWRFFCFILTSNKSVFWRARLGLSKFPWSSFENKLNHMYSNVGAKSPVVPSESMNVTSPLVRLAPPVTVTVTVTRRDHNCDCDRDCDCDGGVMLTFNNYPNKCPRLHTFCARLPGRNLFYRRLIIVQRMFHVCTHWCTFGYLFSRRFANANVQERKWTDVTASCKLM